MVERGSFHNLPEVVKLELCTNPLLSYVDPQAFRLVRPTHCTWTPPTVSAPITPRAHRIFFCVCVCLSPSLLSLLQLWLMTVETLDTFKLIMKVDGVLIF